MEQDFDWAKRYLEDLGYKIEETIATSKLSALKVQELAETAILRDDGEVVLTYQVTNPSGVSKILKPPQIVVIAQSLHDKHGDILE